MPSQRRAGTAACQCQGATPPELMSKPLTENPQTAPASVAQSEPPQSGVLYSPADAMLRQAIADTLKAPAADRAPLFEQFTQQIEAYVTAHYAQRPWTCTVYTGTDGSRIFRGGVGHSLVIDTEGRLWRARSYEDFHTTYALTERSCEIAGLTPLYAQMREYLPE
jgi:hypothetical protein